MNGCQKNENSQPFYWGMSINKLMNKRAIQETIRSGKYCKQLLINYIEKFETCVFPITTYASVRPNLNLILEKQVHGKEWTGRLSEEPLILEASNQVGAFWVVSFWGTLTGDFCEASKTSEKSQVILSHSS